MSYPFPHIPVFYQRIAESGDLITVISFVVLYLIALIAVAHILLVKRDPRAALGWIVVCLGFPGIGTLLYLVFGINRIRIRARDWHSLGVWDFSSDNTQAFSADAIFKSHPDFPADTFRSLVNISESVISKSLTNRSLQIGCHILPLHNGEEAFPRMLKHIIEARESVYLTTYIFETNHTGRQFITELAKAAKRGVDVRVIVDGFGCIYSIPTAPRLLRKAGVRVAKFLSPSSSHRGRHFNLRNHRKIMVVDGKIGYTGGMNIGDRHLAHNLTNRRRVVDLHFQVAGPVVGQLQDAFLDDWHFVTGEKPKGHIFYDNTPKGDMITRGITAGPNEDLEKLRFIYMGAFSCAKHNIRIMVPYFIPDATLISAMVTAVMRGVRVDVILPERNNLPYVKWASQSYFWELLKYGVKIHYQPAPFVHTKFVVIDDFYALIGSSNLDPRSLRLNFEFNMEVFSRELAGQLIHHFENSLHRARSLSIDEMDKRHMLIKLRDGLFKLFSPYL